MIPISDDESDKQPPVVDNDLQPADDHNVRFGFIIVGDNLDETVKPRYMRCDQYRTKSLHYFNSYALKDRIPLDHLQKSHETLHPHPGHVAASTILPSASDDAALKVCLVETSQLTCTMNISIGYVKKQLEH